MENPIHDLGVHLFLETPIYFLFIVCYAIKISLDNLAMEMN